MPDRLNPDELAAIRDAVRNGTPNAANLIRANGNAIEYWEHTRALLAHVEAMEAENDQLRFQWRKNGIETSERIGQLEVENHRLQKQIKESKHD